MTITQTIKEIVMNDLKNNNKWRAYGIRVESDYNAYKVGDETQVSLNGNDNADDYGEEIGGTSAVILFVGDDVVYEDELDEALAKMAKNAMDYIHNGGQIVFIGSADYEYGNDENEIVMPYAEVIAVFENNGNIE